MANASHPAGAVLTDSPNESDAALESVIVVATRRLEAAERELTDALTYVPSRERADKEIASQRMRRALREIVAARRSLSAMLTPPERPIED